jgi:hypothetical protein
MQTEGPLPYLQYSGIELCLKAIESNPYRLADISGSYSGEYEDGCLLGCCAV